MEVVIKIPDDEYKQMKDYPSVWNSHFERIIANGTPLPEGHGRLIEEPTETDISNTVGGNNDFAECIRDSVKAVFDNAKTIIAADKENDDADSD